METLNLFDKKRVDAFRGEIPGAFFV